MIDERIRLLAAEGNRELRIKKAKCLDALIRCQEELDEIYKDVEEQEMPHPHVGDINVTLTPPKGRGGAGGAVSNPFRPFDGGDIAREMAEQLRKAIR